MAEIIRMTPEDLDTLGVMAERPSAIRRIRDHHHLMARLVAEGKRTNEVARETGMSISRVSILKGDPAFQQLVEMYRVNYNQLREAAFMDVMKKIALLEANAIDTMNDRYDEDPDSISHEQARADAEFAGDRLGRKVHQSLNVNVSGNQSLAERLEEQRLRAERLAAGREESAAMLNPPAQDPSSQGPTAPANYPDYTEDPKDAA